jgi:hypothetical protein
MPLALPMLARWSGRGSPWVRGAEVEQVRRAACRCRQSLVSRASAPVQRPQQVSGIVRRLWRNVILNLYAMAPVMVAPHATVVGLIGVATWSTFGGRPRRFGGTHAGGGT